MDRTHISIHDVRNSNTFRYWRTSSVSDSPPPLKRMRQSFSSSLDMNDSSSMEYDNNVGSTYEYRTDQSLEYQTEVSVPSQDVLTCSSTCTASIYPKSNAEIDVSRTATRPIVRKVDDYDRTSKGHKRRLMNVGSNTFGSCSTNISQSSTLTELSLMDDDNIVLIDDICQDLPSPDYGSGFLYNEEVERHRTNSTNDSTSEMDDAMMMDSSVAVRWDHDFVLHGPTMNCTNRRTKEQVQNAKRSINRIHFQT